MAIDEIIRAELETDRIADDVTSRLLGEKGLTSVQAEVRAKSPGVFAGDTVVEAFGRIYGSRLEISALKRDGGRIENGESVVSLKGTLETCLGAERTLLNFLCHLCGVATLTRKYVEKAGGVKILATRKTLPGLRQVQLQAVVAGGGYIHRRSLSDGILIKENHQIFEKIETLLGKAASTKSPLHGIEVEVQNLTEVERVLPFNPSVVMLDNFSLKDLEIAISKIRKISGCAIEISGGVNLETVKGLAELKPDFISVGALTHSAPSLDLSLDIVGESTR